MTLDFPVGPVNATTGSEQGDIQGLYLLPPIRTKDPRNTDLTALAVKLRANDVRFIGVSLEGASVLSLLCEIYKLDQKYHEVVQVFGIGMALYPTDLAVWSK